jgi:hypothetical protein
MSLLIEHLETRPKNWNKPERRPTLILMQANEAEITKDLPTVFRQECEELLPKIFEQAGLHSRTKATWTPGMIGSYACLTTNERTYYDVYVTLGPDVGA